MLKSPFDEIFPRNSHRMVPASDVCWFVNPMNTIVISAINHSEMGVIGTNLANELGHHPAGLLSSLVSLKPPLRDRANVCRHHDAKRVLHLSPAEENVGIWRLEINGGISRVFHGGFMVIYPLVN